MRVMIAVVVGAAMAACSTEGTREARDSSPTSPSASELAVDATPSPDAAGVDTIWRVLVSDLVVRTEPGVTDPDTILPEVLTTDDRVLAVDGPVAVDGYDWYQVLAIRARPPRVLPFGWVAAASRQGEPWLEREQLECPEVPALGALVRMAPEERLACFGPRPIEFTAGDVGGCGIGSAPVDYQPTWLFGLGGCGFGRNPGDIALLLRFPPDVEQSYRPGDRIRGHFDDPAAATCVAIPTAPEVEAPSRAEAVAICRTQFVVEAVLAAS